MKATRLSRTEFELKMRDANIVIMPKKPDDLFSADDFVAVQAAFRASMEHRVVPLPLPGHAVLRNLVTGETFVLDERTL